MIVFNPVLNVVLNFVADLKCKGNTSMDRSTSLLRDKAYCKIKRAIVTGEYESNSVLYESAISKSLGTSRTPVREAFMRLTEEGLVKNLPNHGYLVTAITVKEIEEIFDLRLCLEKYVIEIALDNDISIDLSEMERWIEEQEKALDENDFWASFEANHHFHVAFISIVDNGTLKNIVQGLKDKPIQSGYRSLKRGANLSEAILEHKEIVAALKTRDKERAVAALRKHVANAKKRTLGIA
jgi:DNA-binding GntR family transcriptional regulator